MQNHIGYLAHLPLITEEGEGVEKLALDCSACRNLLERKERHKPH